MTRAIGFMHDILALSGRQGKDPPFRTTRRTVKGESPISRSRAMDKDSDEVPD